ncbi:MAG: DUF4386 domain-containing protein [Acidimicrobiales bacterium]
MNLRRRIERGVGALFVLATLSSSVGFILLDPVLDDSDLLAGVAAEETQVMLGAFLLLVNSIAVVIIAVLLYPILKDHNAQLARLYPPSRIVESVVLVIGVVGVLSLVTLSEGYVPTDPDAAAFGASAESLLAVYDWGALLGILLFFGLAGLILNAVLFQSGLIPRWLAAWGLIGAALLLVEGAFESFGTDGLEALSIPIAVQEMVFAGWLIVRGFASTVTSDTAASERPEPH